jgi:YVTN family beta-propeller protein
MNIFNGFGYIVVNNSKKVEIVNMTDFHLTGTITGLESPRYFLGINNTKGYVSDWTANNIKVLNLTTNTISSTIPCGAGPEQMLLTNNKVFVCNVGGFGNDSTITIIDANSNSVLSTIQVGINPNSIQQDVNGKLWVLCGGTIGPDYSPSTSDDIGGALIQIDPSTNVILKRFDFTSSQHPTKLAINGSKDKLYYLNGSSGYTGKIFNFGITSTYLHNLALVDREFYGLGVDPQNGYVYGGIGNFSLSTYIIKYLSNGTFMDSSKVGVAPSSFVFNY